MALSCTPLSGSLLEEVSAFFDLHGYPGTLEHSRRVGAEAGRLAGRFDLDVDDAATAGLLHDISAVVQPGRRLEIAHELKIEVLPEEYIFPMILHQKISASMARRLFGITDQSILQAIGCHTTLRSGASDLDKVVFLADKLEWDQPGENPLRRQILDAMDRSLDNAAWLYLNHLWQKRETLPVVHPWLVSAWQDLRNSL